MPEWLTPALLIPALTFAYWIGRRELRHAIDAVAKALTTHLESCDDRYAQIDDQQERLDRDRKESVSNILRSVEQNRVDHRQQYDEIKTAITAQGLKLDHLIDKFVKP